MELPDGKRISGVPPVHNHDVVSFIPSSSISFQYSDDISVGFGRGRLVLPERVWADSSRRRK
jgi:hypothetical protein